MKKMFVLMVLFFGLSVQAGELEQIEKPSSVKVAAVFNSWEKIYTPNLCFPDAAAFKITTEKINVKAMTLAAAKSLSKYVKSLTEFSQLKSKTAVNNAAKDALDGLGVFDDKFSAQLFRVYEKVDARQVYVATTSDSSSAKLEGSLIVIVDLENKELVVLTSGDAFDPSRCEE